jgi:hypothetical protein
MALDLSLEEPEWSSMEPDNYYSTDGCGVTAETDCKD